MSPIHKLTCPHCETQITVNVHAKGAAKGASKQAVGCFALAVALELFPDVVLGPNLTILATFVAGQFFYTALSPQQWKALLGG